MEPTMTAQYPDISEINAPRDTFSPALKKQDNRLTQVQNEEAVLYALHRYGHLFTRQIRARVWPDSRTERQAQRTLANLKKAKQVLEQYAPDGCRGFCLSAAGARRVSAVFKVVAVPGTSALKRCFFQVAHRAFSNDLCIWWETSNQPDGDGINSEYEIVSKQAIINKKEATFGKTRGKIPDALLLKKPFKDPVKGLVRPVGWCEVEMSDKPATAYAHLVSEICQILGGYGKNRFELDDGKSEIHFVVVACPKPSHEMKLVRAVMTHLESKALNQSYIKRGICIWNGSGLLVTLEDWFTAHQEMKSWLIEMQVQRRYQRERENDAKERARRGH